MTDFNEGVTERCNACGDFCVNRSPVQSGDHAVKIKAECQSCGSYWFETVFQDQSKGLYIGLERPSWDSPRTV